MGVYVSLDEGGILESLGKRIDKILSTKIHPDKVNKIKAKGLWARSKQLSVSGSNKITEHYAYYPIWKPIKGCVACMASIWGAFIFAYYTQVFGEWTKELIWIAPIYIITLAGLNRILAILADL